ncbi:hypothetical protein P280DRAFT_530105 [Massarina eburnea CBS 473.64]|uniref:Uncharacterized protein n=1 Tax=Massarina eburnea CBS 473.64 TaxID=1395130 RepID=A0A6A6RRC1_9PLEO|nr:hypothetical protein P280DRAFT_530105 [Massarina eburnea CBS 473.64]
MSQVRVTIRKRATKAEAIKETADAELVLGDAKRATTDKAFIDATKAACNKHSHDRVIAVVARMDEVSDNTVKSKVGPVYSQIKALISETEVQDGYEDDLIAFKYLAYLKNLRTRYMLLSRSLDIEARLSQTLQSPDGHSLPITFIASTQCLDWIATNTISFGKRPFISVEETGEGSWKCIRDLWQHDSTSTVTRIRRMRGR